MKRHHPAALTGALLLLLAGCGGGGSNAAPPSTDLLLRDAPIDDLTGFSIAIDSVRFLDAAAVPSANQLIAPVTVDLVALGGAHRWLATGPPPTGTWTQVELGFDTTSIRARALDGTPVAVTPVSPRLVVDLPAPVDGATYRRVEVDLDLAASLSGDVATPPIVFDPMGAASETAGDLPLWPFDGRVLSASVGDLRATVDAFADGDLLSAVGSKRVLIPTNGVLNQENGQPYGDLATFLANLQPGFTVLETSGVLREGGRVAAARIDVRKLFGGGSPTAAEIHGFVSAHTPGTGFDLQIAAVTRGGAVAEPVLLTLGDPAVVSVSYDATAVFRDEAGLPAASADLAVGQRVDVEFSDFTNPPFPARRVDFLAPLTVVGTVTAALDPTGVLAIATPGGPRRARVTEATRVLVDAGHRPPAAPADLAPGLEVEVLGTAEGPRADDAVAAAVVRIRPGRLVGVVTGASPGLAHLTVAVDAVPRPFGRTVPSGPVYATLDPGAVVRGDAADAAGLFDRFARLAPGRSLRVEILGTSTGADEVRACEVVCRVE